MDYLREGNLHKYLQKNFANIKWLKKLHFVWEISRGLDSVHKNHFVHNDFHSGNIIISSSYECQIGDLGLSQPANITSLNNNEVYGVIPYLAPEIFNGAPFSKESDIYSFGMIMWEMTTGCKPFANVDHNSDLIDRIVDGERPEITNDTPVCFANLMKRCWDSNPAKRPTAKDISDLCYYWLARQNDVEEFDQAEEKRAAMVSTGHIFSKGTHPGAIYNSRSLNSLICKSKNFRMNQAVKFPERHSIQETSRSLLNVPETNQDINKRHSIQENFRSLLYVPENDQDINSKRQNASRSSNTLTSAVKFPERHSIQETSHSSSSILNVLEINQDINTAKFPGRHSIQETYHSLSSVLDVPENNQDINKKCSGEELEAKKPTKPINDTQINNIVVVVEGDDDDDDVDDPYFGDEYYSSEDERLLAEELKRKYKSSGDNLYSETQD